MNKPCENKRILNCTGIIGITCDSSMIAIEEGDDLTTLIENGEAFPLTASEGIAYSGVEAQTATSSDGLKTYVTQPAKDGYTMDFEPTYLGSLKTQVLADHCDRAFLVEKTAEGKILVYGVAKKGKLEPFKLTNVNALLPNGRYGNASNMPTNQIGFTFEQSTKQITYNLAFVEVDELEDLELAVMDVEATANSATVTFASASDLHLDFDQKRQIKIVDTTPATTLSVTAFEGNQTMSDISIESDGTLKITTTAALTQLLQVKPILGILAVNTWKELEEDM